MFNPKPDREPRHGSNLKIVSSRSKSTENRRGSPMNSILLVLVICGVITFGYYVIASDGDSPTVTNEDGEEVLSPDRQAKLDRELEEIDNALQYALIADVSRDYPCFTCPDGSNTIFLYKGEVWRYGSTRKGEKGRYPSGNYGAPNLSFIVQFKGHTVSVLRWRKLRSIITRYYQRH